MAKKLVAFNCDLLSVVCVSQHTEFLSFLFLLSGGATSYFQVCLRGSSVVGSYSGIFQYITCCGIDSAPSAANDKLTLTPGGGRSIVMRGTQSKGLIVPGAEFLNLTLNFHGS